ncbi:MAG: hypothetical protein ACREV0_03750 [Burkholderiales bacterium]
MIMVYPLIGRDDDARMMRDRVLQVGGRGSFKSAFSSTPRSPRVMSAIANSAWEL